MRNLPHHEYMTKRNRPIEQTKSRCVGILDEAAVYFVGTRTSFHLAVESAPGVLRRLTDEEHLRFKQQSRIAGLCYGEYLQ